jgi:hypothetical protein
VRQTLHLRLDSSIRDLLRSRHRRDKYDELIQANRDLLNALITAIFVSIDKKSRGQPVPADPGIPVIHGLNLSFRHLDPGKIVSRLSARQAHPHEARQSDRRGIRIVVLEGIEEVGAKLQVRRLPKLESLGRRQVVVEHSRKTDGACAGRSSELPWQRLRERCSRIARDCGQDR